MTPTTRARLRGTLSCLLPAAAMFALAWYLGPTTGTGAIRYLFPSGAAALVLACTLVHRVAARFLGTTTAWAALIVVTAGLFAVVFANTPSCYTGAGNAPCTARGVTDWAVAGGLLPVLALVVIALPWKMLRGYARATVWIWRKFGLLGTARAHTAADTPAREADQAAVAPATRQDPPGAMATSTIGSAPRRDGRRSGNPAVRAAAAKPNRR